MKTEITQKLFVEPDYFGCDIVTWALNKHKTQMLLDCSKTGDVYESIQFLAKELQKEYTFERKVLLKVCIESGGWERSELRTSELETLLNRALFVSIPDYSDLISDIISHLQDAFDNSDRPRDVAKQICEMYDNSGD
jgi:hypothetical protein